MNLTKISHTHTFSDMDRETHGGVAAAPGPFDMCPLGHSDCQVGHLEDVTYHVYHTNRTVARNSNLCAKSHLHSLQRKGCSSVAKATAIGYIEDCESGHTWCHVQVGWFYGDTLLITISGLVGGETTPFVPGNLTKMVSHTHTVINSIVDASYRSWAIVPFDECAAGHSNCMMINAHPIWAISYDDATTSSGVV